MLSRGIHTIKWRWQNYRSIQRFRQRVLNAAVNPENVVFVYQMGKVASSTVRDSLEGAGYQVFHAHVLNFPPDKPVPGPFATQIKKGRILYDTLIKPRYPLKIVTLVREPIARNISAYFENLDAIWETHDAYAKTQSNELIAGFLDKYDHTIPLTWFDREFRPVLGIYVYDYAFSFDKGYSIIKKDGYAVLMMRAELKDIKKKEAIGRFLGTNDFNLAHSNVSSKKKYADEYKRFTDAISLPPSYINEMLQSQYARHFYSPSELMGIRDKWSARGKPNNRIEI